MLPSSEVSALSAGGSQCDVGGGSGSLVTVKDSGVLSSAAGAPSSRMAADRSLQPRVSIPDSSDMAREPKDDQSVSGGMYLPAVLSVIGQPRCRCSLTTSATQSLTTLRSNGSGQPSLPSLYPGLDRCECLQLRRTPPTGSGPQRILKTALRQSDLGLKGHRRPCQVDVGCDCAAGGWVAKVDLPREHLGDLPQRGRRTAYATWWSSPTESDPQCSGKLPLPDIDCWPCGN